MDELTHKWMNRLFRRMDKRRVGVLYAGLDARQDGRINLQINRYVDGWMDGRMDVLVEEWMHRVH